MIIDQLTNHRHYAALSERINQVFDFLITHPPEQFTQPRYELDGDRVFVMVQQYDTQPEDRERLFLEGHKKYLDLHYMAKGSEMIGYTPQQGQVMRKPYDENEDYHLFQGEYLRLLLSEGMFCICYPPDLHLPRLSVDSPQAVKKIVAKIKIS